MFIGVIGLLYWGGYLLGGIAAERTVQRHAEQDFPDFPYTQIRLTNDPKVPLSPSQKKYREDLQNGCYQLIFRNQGNAYLLKRPVDDQKPHVEIIPKERIVHLRILADYPAADC